MGSAAPVIERVCGRASRSPYAAEKHHLIFGPNPSTHDHCTPGRMSGNNSCGVHSVMAGRTSDNVEELDILAYDGLRMRVGRTDPEEFSAIIEAGPPPRGERFRSSNHIAVIPAEAEGREPEPITPGPVIMGSGFAASQVGCCRRGRLMMPNLG